MRCLFHYLLVRPMNARLIKQFRFEAAHRLTCVGETHPCGRMHGHSYRIELTLEGAVDPQTGWLIDFGELEQAWLPVKCRLDHAVLNELPDLENPTCENLTRWIWNELVGALPMLKRVTLWETSDARCEYEGEKSSSQISSLRDASSEFASSQIQSPEAPSSEIPSTQNST